MTTTVESNQTSLDCPVCGVAVTDGHTACQQCDVDLGPLLLVDGLAPAYYNQGLRFAREGKVTQAMEQLHMALSFNPLHTDTLVVMGKLYAQQTRYNQAVSCWQQALTIDPNNAKAWAGIRKVKAQKTRAGLWRRILVVTAAVVVALLVAISFWVGRNFAATGSPKIAVTPALPPTKIPSLVTPVQAILQADDSLKSLEIAVRQDGHTIYLSGAVPNPELKEQVETLVKEIPGVKAVDSSGIDIVPPPLFKAVQEALQANPDIGLVEVEQAGNNIRLSGNIPTVELKNLAVEITRGVAGVQLVDSSNLLVVPPDLTQPVKDALANNPQLAGVYVVDQNANAIRLGGKVKGTELKNLAEELTGAVEGVEFVDSRELVVLSPPLVEMVRQALQADPRTAGYIIQVNQIGSGIKLEGTVPTLEAKTTVESIVRNVANVQLVDATAMLVEPSSVDYTVQEGDSLASIAKKFYGNESKWPFIYQANRGIILRPGLLQPGIHLLIPQDIN